MPRIQKSEHRRFSETERGHVQVHILEVKKDRRACGAGWFSVLAGAVTYQRQLQQLQRRHKKPTLVAFYFCVREDDALKVGSPLWRERVATAAIKMFDAMMRATIVLVEPKRRRRRSS